MKKKAQIRYTVSFLILAVLLLLLFIWNINAGSVHLSVKEIFDIIVKKTGEQTAYNIVWQIRLPRILAAILLGGALSVSGFLLQTFFGNPIAGPFVLGISSGAKLVVSLVMIFLLSKGIASSSAVMILAGFCRSHDFHGIYSSGFQKSKTDVHAGYLWSYDRIYLLSNYRLRSDICR